MSDYEQYLFDDENPLFPESIKLQEKQAAMEQECRYERVIDDIDVMISRTDGGYVTKLVKSVVDEAGKRYDRVLISRISAVPPWTSQNILKDLVKQGSGVMDLQGRTESYIHTKLSELFAAVTETAEDPCSDIAWMLSPPGVKMVMAQVVNAVAWPATNPEKSVYTILFREDESDHTQEMIMPLTEWISDSPHAFKKHWTNIYMAKSNCPVRNKTDWLELRGRLTEIMTVQERFDLENEDDLLAGVLEHIRRNAIFTPMRNDLGESSKHVFCDRTEGNWHLYIPSRLIESALGGVGSFERYSAILTRRLRNMGPTSPFIEIARLQVRGIRTRYWVFDGEKIGFNADKLTIPPESVESHTTDEVCT